MNSICLEQGLALEKEPVFRRHVLVLRMRFLIDGSGHVR
jgi:hypothetical protein